MVTATRRFEGLVTALLVVSLVASCTTERTSNEPSAEEALDEAEAVPVDGLLADEVDFEGAELWVGSPESAEDDATSALLAAILTEALGAGNATVEDRTELGGGFLLRDSLVSGEIDLYWENTGAALTQILREPADGLDAAGVYERLSTQDLEEHGVAWLTPAGFDVASGFAMPPDQSEALEVTSITEMATYLDETDEEPTVCVTSAFTTFPDEGRVDFEETLGVGLPEETLRVYDPVPIYPDTGRGTCVFGQVERTSGRVPQYELVLLDDDAGLFLPNPPAISVREDVLLEHPQLATVAAAVSARLTTEVIQELNRQVVVEGEDPSAVARSWLRSEGLVAA